MYCDRCKPKYFLYARDCAECSAGNGVTLILVAAATLAIGYACKISSARKRLQRKLTAITKLAEFDFIVDYAQNLMVLSLISVPYVSC